MPHRICLWSGPRNISTALMYSFAQRSDTSVVDEPLYAHYLSTTDAHTYHPGSAEVIAIQENDGDKVVRDVILAAQPTKKFVTFDELNALALFLADDKAGSINGAALSIDGGWTAK